MMDQITAPVKTLTECWQNEKRVNALFSPFRKKELNPVDWESKMKFWHSAIEDWCLEKNDCVISIKKMQQVFKRKHQSPACLTTVVEQLLRNGEVKGKEEFLSTLPNASWRDWIVTSFVKTPAVWSFSKLKEALYSTDISEIQYIYLNFLKVQGNELLQKVRDRKEYVLYIEDVKSILHEEGPKMSDETISLILHWLHNQKKVSYIEFEGKKLVKFSENDTTPASISEAEVAFYTLQQNKAALVKNLELLELEKQQSVEEARNYIKKGMRATAKSCLRKKKELEKCIDKRAAALDNTEVLISKIKEAESDAKLVEAYKVGLTALKVTFKNAGLTEDSVINTMAEVHEAIDIHNEIQSALSETIEPVMDDELEEELSELIRTRPVIEHDKESPPVPNKDSLSSFLSDLPSVPVDLPQNNVINEKKKEMVSAALST